MTIQNLGSKTTALDLLANDVVAATGVGSAIDYKDMKALVLLYFLLKQVDQVLLML